MPTYAERRAARHARIADLIDKKRAEATGHYNAARAAVEHIPFGQPILVGHHSEGRHRRDLARSHAAMHRAADTFREAERLESTTATRAVLVTDSDAVEVMADKLAKAEELQARMSAANRVVRKFKGDPEGGANALVAACPWLTSTDAADLMRPDFAGRLGFADYQLSNNNANIRRMRDRLAELKAAQAAPARSRTVGNVQVDEDPDTQRIRLVFPGKPAPEMIARLKSHGFRWAPSCGAWQRQLNAAGRYAVQQVLPEAPAPAAAEPAPVPEAVKIVREFSPAGPCLTAGKLVRETAQFYVYLPWKGGRAYGTEEKRIAKKLPGRYSAAHVEPCHSCRDHAQTQYPNGYMD